MTRKRNSKTRQEDTPKHNQAKYASGEKNIKKHKIVDWTLIALLLTIIPKAQQNEFNLPRRKTPITPISAYQAVCALSGPGYQGYYLYGRGHSYYIWNKLNEGSTSSISVILGSDSEPSHSVRSKCIIKSPRAVLLAGSNIWILHGFPSVLSTGRTLSQLDYATNGVNAAPSGYSFCTMSTYRSSRYSSQDENNYAVVGMVRNNPTEGGERRRLLRPLVPEKIKINEQQNRNCFINRFKRNRRRLTGSQKAPANTIAHYRIDLVNGLRSQALYFLADTSLTQLSPSFNILYIGNFFVNSPQKSTSRSVFDATVNGASRSALHTKIYGNSFEEQCLKSAIGDTSAYYSVGVDNLGLTKLAKTTLSTGATQMVLDFPVSLPSFANAGDCAILPGTSMMLLVRTSGSSHSDVDSVMVSLSSSSVLSSGAVGYDRASQLSWIPESSILLFRSYTQHSEVSMATRSIDFSSQNTVPCLYRCETCSSVMSPDSCKSCNSSYVFVRGDTANEGRCDCPSGSTDTSSSNCRACHETCSTCSNTGSNGCLICKDQTNHVLSNGICSCRDGYVWNSTTLQCQTQTCHQSCSKCEKTSSTSCTECYSGMTINDSGTCSCSLSQTYFDSTSKGCLDCDPTCQSCSGPGPTACTSCKQFMFLNSSNQCECTEGYVLDAAKSSCVTPLKENTGFCASNCFASFAVNLLDNKIKLQVVGGVLSGEFRLQTSINLNQILSLQELAKVNWQEYVSVFKVSSANTNNRSGSILSSNNPQSKAPSGTKQPPKPQFQTTGTTAATSTSSQIQVELVVQDSIIAVKFRDQGDLGTTDTVNVKINNSPSLNNALQEHNLIYTTQSFSVPIEQQREAPASEKALETTLETTATITNNVQVTPVVATAGAASSIAVAGNAAGISSYAFISFFQVMDILSNFQKVNVNKTELMNKIFTFLGDLDFPDIIPLDAIIKFDSSNEQAYLIHRKGGREKIAESNEDAFLLFGKNVVLLPAMLILWLVHLVLRRFVADKSFWAIKYTSFAYRWILGNYLFDAVFIMFGEVEGAQRLGSVASFAVFSYLFAFAFFVFLMVEYVRTYLILDKTRTMEEIEELDDNSMDIFESYMDPLTDEAKEGACLLIFYQELKNLALQLLIATLQMIPHLQVTTMLALQVVFYRYFITALFKEDEEESEGNQDSGYKEEGDHEKNDQKSANDNKDEDENQTEEMKTDQEKKEEKEGKKEEDKEEQSKKEEKAKNRVVVSAMETLFLVSEESCILALTILFYYYQVLDPDKVDGFVLYVDYLVILSILFTAGVQFVITMKELVSTIIHYSKKLMKKLNCKKKELNEEGEVNKAGEGTKKEEDKGKEKENEDDELQKSSRRGLCQPNRKSGLSESQGGVQMNQEVLNTEEIELVTTRSNKQTERPNMMNNLGLKRGGDRGYQIEKFDTQGDLERNLDNTDPQRNRISLTKLEVENKHNKENKNDKNQQEVRFIGRETRLTKKSTESKILSKNKKKKGGRDSPGKQLKSHPNSHKFNLRESPNKLRLISTSKPTNQPPRGYVSRAILDENAQDRKSAKKDFNVRISWREGSRQAGGAENQSQLGINGVKSDSRNPFSKRKRN